MPLLPCKVPRFRGVVRFALGVLLLLAASVVGVLAQGIESILSPGNLVESHAKIEYECKLCHVKFDRQAQDAQCMACHKAVGQDVRGKMGFHGRVTGSTCRACHTDHKGRDAKVADFDKKKFDHNKTDFALIAKHAKVNCDGCHVWGKKYREALTECQACHTKDDVHRGSLRAKCGDCHSEVNWKETRVDHSITRFRLTGKHGDVKCADCHKNAIYKETSRYCYACHKKEDEGKGHKTQFGEKCDACHTTKQWKNSTFHHDTETKYALRGKHGKVGCKDCHSGNLYKDKLSQDCYSCHKKDDRHKESLGKECSNCHSDRSWKESAGFDHAKTTFPLLGKHPKLECKDCHKSLLFNEAPKDCYGCHQKDDKHKATLGKECADCHVERDWKATEDRFKHDRTKFQLRNGHAQPGMKCSACHKDQQSFRNTPLDCFSCHKKDDQHVTQLGSKCETCHSEKTWKNTQFDHTLSRFPLTGRHALAACKGCHETLRYKDAPRDCYSCHSKADKHKQKFGMSCDTCHNSRSWSIWKFDHDVRTKYPLSGAHRKVACEQCHTQAAPKGKYAAPTGGRCISCHRNDDVHFEQFGVRCDQCHTAEAWKKY